MQSGQPHDLDHEGIQEFRIERGAQVLGPDGPLGTVQLIVVDQATGALQGLVVRGEAGMDMELPVSYLESATGDRVYLSIGRADLAAHPELAQPYRPELYQPVDEGVAVPPGQVLARDTGGPVLTEMEADAVGVAAPASHEPQLDDLKATAALPDIADEPTVVLGPAAGAGQDSAQRDSESVQTPKQPPAPGAESAVAGTSPTGTAAGEGAGAEASHSTAAPASGATAEATPLEAAPSETPPIKPAPAETSPAGMSQLPAAESEALFPGALPFAPAGAASADEAHAASQTPVAESPTVPSAAPGLKQEPAAEPRTVPVLRPEHAGATAEAAQNAQSRPTTDQLPSAGQARGDQLLAGQPSEASTALRRMAAAGVLAGSGVAAVAYLMWRWRQNRRARSAPAKVRTRAQAARSAGTTLVNSLRGGLAPGLPLDLRASLPDVRARLQDAGAAAGNLAEQLRRGLPSSLPGNVPVSLPDVRQSLQAAARTGQQLGQTLPDVAAALDAVRSRGIDRAMALARGVDTASLSSSARDRLLNLGSGLRARARDIANDGVIDGMRASIGRLARSARSTREQLSNIADSARQGLADQAGEIAGKAAPARAPRRAPRRAGRRARWFRRGLIAGLAWGIFYAPESGDDARDRLLGRWQRIQHRLGVGQMQREPDISQASGTGPSPRNPVPEETAPLGTDRSSPLMQPRSEEPLMPPPLPEAASDEVAGAQPQI